MSPLRARLSVTSCLLALSLAGCLTDANVLQLPDAGDHMTAADGGMPMGSAGGSGTAASNGDAGTSSPRPTQCVHDGYCVSLDPVIVDKLDLLFVIDNSNSMQEEQKLLTAQFPRLFQQLQATSGPLAGRIRDLHVGVVSTDMGVRGVVGIGGCSPRFGDDGVLQHAPSPSVLGCDDAYPPFLEYLSYVGQPDLSPELTCIATLGTNGCGFEQPLESALKALWPKTDLDDVTGRVIMPNRVTFVGNTDGHGDQENRGFLRRDPSLGLPLLGVIVVSDEDDGSVRNPTLYAPQSSIKDTADPRYNEPLNTRAYYDAMKAPEQQDLYPVSRYINGLQALHAGNEDLVFFGAITGVPPELVNDAALANFDRSNAIERDALYTRILDDSRMQPKLDPAMQGENILPSCKSTHGSAFPPVRLAKTAQGFGENGFVASICEPDLSSATDRILEQVNRRSGENCLTDSHQRSLEGLISCDVIWELPAPGTAPTGTPTECEQVSFLKKVSSPRKKTSATGGNVCALHQVPVATALDHGLGVGEGWYYDDFSDERAANCRTGATWRVAYTPLAKPPSGVAAYLDCK